MTTLQQQQTRRRPRLALGALVASVVLAPALASPPHVPVPTPVNAEGVRVLAIDEGHHTLPGATRHRRAVTLGTSFDARLMKLLVEEGERVSAGQVIARLDDRVAAASLALAQEEASHEAPIAGARARLERATRTLQRALDAHSRDGVSDEELDDARTGVELAAAELAQAQEGRAAAKRKAEQAAARLDEHTIRAPFDGTIVRIRAEIGAVLRTGDPVAELADPQRMSIDLYLPAAAAIRVEPGVPYAIEIDAPVARVLWARARYVEPRVDPTSNTMRTVFDFEAPAGAIPAGVLVRPAPRVPTDEELAYLERPQGTTAEASPHRQADATTPGP